jgi:hypothetical protein
MKILSNEQLIAAYRDAEKNERDRDLVSILRKEVDKRGINPSHRQK